MLFIEALRNADHRLRWLAFSLLAGMGILLSSLWYTQVLSAKRYKANEDDQLYRTVRVPAPRGKIMDRNGEVLADNRPLFQVDLFLEEVRREFAYQFNNSTKPGYLAAHPGSPVKGKVLDELQRQARFAVVSNYSATVSQLLGTPNRWTEQTFQNFYLSARTLPLPLATGLTPEQVARFSENCSERPSLALNVQRVRVYPFKTLAAHLIGALKESDGDTQDEDDFSYQFRLPDYVGVKGIEWAFDKELRGRAGVKMLTVNSMSYRQSESMLVNPEPGGNVVLTIDQRIQRATDQALAGAGTLAKEAAVVMDVQSGDIIAVSSAPTFDPNSFIVGISAQENERLRDPETEPMFNKAMRGTYFPGSTFKIIDSLAGIESGVIDPNETFKSLGYFQIPGKTWKDTAGAGDFNFRKAFALSSNPYFIYYGLRVGTTNIVSLGRQFGLGQPTGIIKDLDAVLIDGKPRSGYFPNLPLIKNSKDPWRAGDSGNLMIGQGEINVTPLQMAVLTSAVANRGKVLQPRIVMRIETDVNAPVPVVTQFPSGQVRNTVRLSPRTWDLVHQAMLDDVEYRNPSGKNGSGEFAFIQGLHIGGKTGTAEVEKNGSNTGRETWFVSFAPVEAPRYAVVVMVQSGSSGGKTCAPIARKIYQALLEAGLLKLS